MEALTAVFGMIFNILKVVFGLGLVIFIHELGHFLAAKWNGVKVDKFYLGFDFFGLKIASFRYGETEYGIGGIPLGGYVKMLGEEPSEGSETSSDPRAFSNKSVGARTVILSAGVVMNLILGLILFTTTHILGVLEQPARLGWIVGGSPAYEAGLREGDEIVSINGRGDVNYMRLKLKVSLSAANQKVNLGVKRPGSDETLTIAVEPKRQANAGMPNIGVVPCNSLILYKIGQWTDLPGSVGPPPDLASLPPEGTIIEGGPTGGPLNKLADSFDLDRVLMEYREKPVDVVVESKVTKDEPQKTTKATLPVNHFVTFGLRMTPGKVGSIQTGSSAEKAGFQKGDRIVSVDNHDDYDPIRLPDLVFNRAGQPTAFIVEREVEGKLKTVTLTATPDGSIPWLNLMREGTETMIGRTEPYKIPGLGLAIYIDPKIAAVAENSPASKAGLKAGVVIKEILIPPIKENTKEKASRLVFTEDTKLDGDAIQATWPYAFTYLQIRPKCDVKFTFTSSDPPVTLSAEPDLTWTNPNRGLGLMPTHREIPPQPFGSAFKRGLDDTYDNVISIYAMIRSLFSGRVSTNQLAGLPRIADIAYQSADAGAVALLSFLGMLSINLAVLNFLPIPPLDGGQIAFLIAEKIRGKPLPDSTLNVLIIGGLALVGSLMVFTIGQDIWFMIGGKR